MSPEGVVAGCGRETLERWLGAPEVDQEEEEAAASTDVSKQPSNSENDRPPPLLSLRVKYLGCCAGWRAEKVSVLFHPNYLR